jgi:hypothetical protein
MIELLPLLHAYLDKTVVYGKIVTQRLKTIRKDDLRAFLESASGNQLDSGVALL